MKMMEKGAKIYVAGHRGLVGSAIIRKLKEEGYTNIVTRTHSELDLTDQRATREFFEKERLDYVFLAAAKVGGILANDTYKADFIYQNIMIAANVIETSYRYGVKKTIEPWFIVHLSEIRTTANEGRIPTHRRVRTNE